MDEILEQQVKEGQVNTRNRRRGRGQSENETIVNNPQTQALKDTIAKLDSKVSTLSTKLNKLTSLHKEISQKQSIVQKLKENESIKGEFRKGDIKSRIDFTPIDEIFDGLWEDDIGGMFFSVVNLIMLCVIIVSGYLWFKLDKFEKNN